MTAPAFDRPRFGRPGGVRAPRKPAADGERKGPFISRFPEGTHTVRFVWDNPDLTFWRPTNWHTDKHDFAEKGKSGIFSYPCALGRDPMTGDMVGHCIGEEQKEAGRLIDDGFLAFAPVIHVKDDNEYIDVFEIKWSVFSDLLDIFADPDDGGSITHQDIKVSRKGQGLDTKWSAKLTGGPYAREKVAPFQSLYVELGEAMAHPDPAIADEARERWADTNTRMNIPDINKMLVAQYERAMTRYGYTDEAPEDLLAPPPPPPDEETSATLRSLKSASTGTRTDAGSSPEPAAESAPAEPAGDPAMADVDFDELSNAEIKAYLDAEPKVDYPARASRPVLISLCQRKAIGF